MALLQFISDAEFLLKGAARLEGTKTEVGRHAGQETRTAGVQFARVR